MPQSFHLRRYAAHSPLRGVILLLLAALAAAAVTASARSRRLVPLQRGAHDVPGLAAVEPIVANRATTPCLVDGRRLAPASRWPAHRQRTTRPHPAREGVVAASAGVAGVRLELGGQATSSSAPSTRPRSSAARPARHRVRLLVRRRAADRRRGDPGPRRRPLDLEVGPLRVRANQVDGSTRRALEITLGEQDVVIGEATAGGDACAPAPSAPPAWATATATVTARAATAAPATPAAATAPTATAARASAR